VLKRCLLIATLSLYQATTAQSAPIMIFMGGFGSCPIAGYTSELKASAMIEKTMTAVNRSNRQGEAIEIRTCYAIGNDTIYASAEQLGLESTSMPRESLAGWIKEIYRDYPNAPVYIWGQSHGGWTALDLVRSLPELNYRILHTVDPISVVDCAPGNFIEGILLDSAPGCRRAPQDLRSHYSQISQRVSRWTNWYQQEFPLLHSGPISNAHENIERYYDASFWTLAGAHAEIEKDEVIWRRLIQEITRDLANLN
jgi:hypothetical protein